MEAGDSYGSGDIGYVGCPKQLRVNLGLTSRAERSRAQHSLQERPGLGTRT